MILPIDAAARKRVPVFSGFVAYFPRSICEVAKVSFEGNEQHHPGAPLHWDKSKSTDHLDALMRHLIDAVDAEHDPVHALAQVTWRAHAELETRLEAVDQSASTARRHGDIDAVCGMADRERASVQSGTHPMHHIALEMAEKASEMPSATRKLVDVAMAKTAPRSIWDVYADPPSVDAACAYLERVSKPQTVADEPWEHAP